MSKRQKKKKNYMNKDRQPDRQRHPDKVLTSAHPRDTMTQQVKMDAFFFFVFYLPTLTTHVRRREKPRRGGQEGRKGRTEEVRQDRISFRRGTKV